MTATFSVTLVGLQPDGTRASADFGENSIGQIAAEELQQLLDRFRVVDPIELVTADPEIIIENRRTRFVVRSGEGKLYLQDRSKFDEPTLALTSHEIIAELDGSAKAERIRRAAEAKAREKEALAELAKIEAAIIPVLPTPPSVLQKKHRAGLISIGLGLLGYIGFSLYPANAIEKAPYLESITDEQVLAQQRAGIVGVYMTGPLPGDHGIAFSAEGGVRFFVVNPKAPPSQVQDKFELVRSQGQLCVRTAQPGGIIRFTGPNSLVFSGETYQRLQ